MWLWITGGIVAVLVIVASVVQALLLTRAARRLLQYDELFQLLVDDIETNLRQFERMASMNVLMNEPEVQAAHRNMMVMRMRLDEFLNQMEQLMGKSIRKKTKPMKPVNVTKAAEQLERS